MERWEATLFTSSQEENTIAEFYKLIMAWWSDTLLTHPLTAYHLYATMMTKHQKEHITAQHQVTTPWWLCRFLSVHSRTKLFQFDCHWSIVLPIHRQITYTYNSITATLILAYKGAMNDFKYFTCRSYKNSLLVFECKDYLVFIWHVLCLDTNPSRSFLLQGQWRAGGSLAFHVTSCQKEGQLQEHDTLRWISSWLAFLYSFFWSSKPKDWRKKGKYKYRVC